MPNNTKPSFVNQLFEQLYGSNASANYVMNTAANAAGEDSDLYKKFQEILEQGKSIDPADVEASNKYYKSLQDLFKNQFASQKKFVNNPLGGKDALGTLANGQQGTALKNTMQLLGANIKAHPFKAAGVGALGAANIAGLMDNDKVGGQLVGGLGGGALAHFLPVSPLAKVAIGLGGGTLGSLFDKLRAKKELEQQAMTQQQQLGYGSY